MRIVVTGGNGFIGKHTVDLLRSRGHDVVTVDIIEDPDLDISAPWSSAVSDRFRDAELIVHVAGILGTEELFDQPHQAIDTNVKGTLNILQFCAKASARFVGITLPNVWKNPYAITRQCARDLATAWHLHCGVPVSYVRAFNVFGPGQKVHTVRKIIPTFATAAWAGSPLEVFGSGEQKVDLVHVRDVAKMLVSATAFGGDKTLEAGTGQGLQVTQIARLIIDHVHDSGGPTSEITFSPPRKGEHVVANDLVLARGEGWDRVGWQPAFDVADLYATVDSYRPAAGDSE